MWDVIVLIPDHCLSIYFSWSAEHEFLKYDSYHSCQNDSYKTYYKISISLRARSVFNLHLVNDLGLHSVENITMT